MTKTKKIYLSITILVFIYLVLSIIMPKQITKQKSETLKIPSHVLYNVAAELSNYPDWNYTQSKTIIPENLQSTYLFGQGAKITFDSESVPYEVVILDARPSDSLVIESRKKLQTLKKQIITFEEVDPNQARITLNVTKVSPWPFNVFNFIKKWKLKLDIESGIFYLTKLAEKRINEMTYRGYKIEEVAAEDKYFIYFRNKVDLKNEQGFYTQNISSLFKYAQSNTILTEDYPSALYFDREPESKNFDMAAALPILGEMKLDNMEILHISPQRAYKIVYFGDHMFTNTAHLALWEYTRDHNLVINYPIIEEYFTDPVKEPDPSKWQTNIIYYAQNK